MDITISTPMSVVVDAAARITEKAFDYAIAIRQTESQAARDMQDQISFQAYWDWRAILQKIGLVGEPLKWPPAPPAA
jgi:hypothetical protein